MPDQVFSGSTAAAQVPAMMVEFGVQSEAERGHRPDAPCAVCPVHLISLFRAVTQHDGLCGVAHPSCAPCAATAPAAGPEAAEGGAGAQSFASSTVARMCAAWPGRHNIAMMPFISLVLLSLQVLV